MKIFVIIVLIIAVLCSLSIGYRNQIAKKIIEKALQSLLNQPLTIAEVTVGLTKTDIAVRDLTAYNPGGYKEPVFVKIDELYFDYSLKDVIKGFLHFPEVRLNINQINVEKDSQGILNIDHFKPRLSPSSRKDDSKKDNTKERNKLLINKFDFKIERISYYDNSLPLTLGKTINVNYSHTFKDICSAQSIIAAVRMEVIKILAAKGIVVVANALLTDDKIQQALIKGDVESLKTQGEEKLEEIKEDLKEHFDLDEAEFEEKKEQAKELLKQYLSDK